MITRFYSTILFSIVAVTSISIPLQASQKSAFTKDQPSREFEQEKHGTHKHVHIHNPKHHGEVNIQKNMILDWEAKHHAIPNVKGTAQVNKMLDKYGYVAFEVPIDKKTKALIQGPDGFLLGHFEFNSHKFLCEFVPKHQSVLKWKEFFSVQKRPFVGTMDEYFTITLAGITRPMSKDMIKEIHTETLSSDDDSATFIIDYPSAVSLQRQMVIVKAVRGPLCLIVVQYKARYYNKHQEHFVSLIQRPWREKGLKAIDQVVIAR